MTLGTAMNPRSLVVLTFCVLAACSEREVPPVSAEGKIVPPPKSRAGGSMAVSRDDALLYAADTDNGTLGVIDATNLKVVATVKVGEAPYRVAVAPDDTVFVANRRSRSVSVIRRGEWTVAAELATDVDPVGLGVATDGTVYVVCATASDAAEHGTFTAFDGKTLSKLWSIPVGPEPRGLALVGPSRALVGLYQQGEVVSVDLNARALEAMAPSSLYGSINTTELSRAGPRTFHPRAIADLVESPDGVAFALGSLAREAPLNTPPSRVHPYYEDKGPISAGSVTTAAVFAYETRSVVTPAVDDVSTGTSARYQAIHRPQTSFSAPFETAVLQGPTVGATDSTGELLYVVSRETQTLARIDTRTQWGSRSAVARIGAGADGVVVMADGHTLYVHNQFDHTVQQVFTSNGGVAPPRTATFAGETLTPEQATGRRLFFDASDRRVSSKSAAIACSSCHLEGRDDAHTWQFTDGPRQTPTLVGRGLLETAPFHWSGEFPAMSDFMSHTITARMGGTGLDAPAAAAINAFLSTLAPPENPYLGATLTEEQLRGQQVFTKANCASCHSGPWLTNNASSRVGTATPTDDARVQAQGLNVPSLRGLARSAPYLHDGSAATLSERVRNNPGDQHGLTSTLSEQEKTDLIAYLRTL